MSVSTGTEKESDGNISSSKKSISVKHRLTAEAKEQWYWSEMLLIFISPLTDWVSEVASNLCNVSGGLELQWGHVSGGIQWVSHA